VIYLAVAAEHRADEWDTEVEALDAGGTPPREVNHGGSGAFV
jgi:hypothetical protein